MNKGLIISGIIFILICTTGCILQSPSESPPYSILPGLLLDYDFDSDLTKVWVKSALSDYKYDNITIEITSNDITHSTWDNNTYCLSMVTTFTIFDLYIKAIADDKIFELEINIDIDELREDLIIITTYDDETDKEIEKIIKKDDLPYKKILEEIKEEV